MSGNDTDMPSERRDKQLQGVSLASVLEKRRLDQALSVKEFAVCAGISYSTARSWFHLAGFPVFRGVVFWQDFAAWRSCRKEIDNPSVSQSIGDIATAVSTLPPRAARLLLEV